MAAPVTVVPTIYNAALCGMLAGINARPNTDATATDYNAQVLAAQTFAVLLDSATYLGGIAGITGPLTSAGDTTEVANDAAEFNAAETLPQFVQNLCFAYWFGRSITGTSADTTSGTYTTACAAIDAIVTQALTQLSTA